MSEYSDSAGRRKFLKLVGGSVALVPLAGLAGCGGGNESPPAADATPKPAAGGNAGMAKETKAAAETVETAAAGQSGAPASGGGDMPKLALDDPQAKALGYVHDAGNVDQSKYARYKEGQLCSNCALFQAKGNEEWAGCSIFPGKLVNASGWCSAYAPKG